MADEFGRAIAKVYVDLRRQIITLDPASIGIAPTGARPMVWAVLLELGYPDGIATIVAIRDGTASMYTSSGGGLIGGGGRPAVAAEAVRFLDIVDGDIDALSPADALQPPGPGHTNIHARTFAGNRSGGALTDELATGSHPLSRMYLAGHELITQLRLSSQ